jgi:ribonuclease HI
VKLVVYADGASRGNPGPAAIGASVQDERGSELAAVSQRIGIATNNEAEYRAAIEGLRRAKALGATAAELRMDSELVVRQVIGTYRVKKPHLQPLYAALMAAMDDIGQVSIGHVRREANRRADWLANAALDGKPVEAGEGGGL